MIDKVQDFFKELRTRLSNPFFSSFLIAWLIINWRVPVALLFYKTAEWITAEKSTYIGYIEKIVTVWTGVLWPLVSAIAYTIFAPIIKNLVRAFTAYMDSKGTAWTLSAIKGGVISVEKYMELRADYWEKSAALLEVYKEESQYREQNRELSRQVEQLRKEAGDRSDELRRLISRSEIDFYKGHWRLTYTDERGNKQTDTVSWYSGEIRQTDRETKLLFKVTRIGYSSELRELLITMEDRRQTQPRTIFVVLFQHNQDQPIFINRMTEDVIEQMERVVAGEQG